MGRRVRPEVRREIEMMEGLPGGKPALKAYLDVAGVPTIGFGHTRGVRMGDTCTIEQAVAWLMEDLADAERAVERYVQVRLNDNQFGALVSFVFNVGVGAFRNSTLLRMLNDGRFDAVPAQLARWNKARNPRTNKLEVVNGLVNRRSAEIALWSKPDPRALAQSPAEERSRTSVESGVRPEPPPSPTKVTDTSTGKAQTTALVAGSAAAGTELVERSFGDTLRAAITQIEPLAWMIESMKFIFVGLTLALIAWTLWDRRRKVREEGR